MTRMTYTSVLFKRKSENMAKNSNGSGKIFRVSYTTQEKFTRSIETRKADLVGFGSLRVEPALTQDQVWKRRVH
jgi:hypothetical protein